MNTTLKDLENIVDHTKKQSLNLLATNNKKGRVLDDFPYLSKVYIKASMIAEEFNEGEKLLDDTDPSKSSHYVKVVHVMDFLKFIESRKLNTSSPINNVDTHPKHLKSEVDKSIVKNSLFYNYSIGVFNYLQLFNFKDKPYSLTLKFFKDKILTYHNSGSDYILLYIPRDLTFYDKFKKSFKLKIINVMYRVYMKTKTKENRKVFYAVMASIYFIISLVLVLIENKTLKKFCLGGWILYLFTSLYFLTIYQKLDRCYDPLCLEFDLEDSENEIIKTIYSKK